MLKLEALQGHYSVCRFSSNAAMPAWGALDKGSFVSVTRTDQELSILLPQAMIPEHAEVPGVEHGWRGLRLVGPFDFAEVGILVQLLVPLRDAKIPMLAMSTFDTDYVFVKQENFERTLECLEAAGIEIRNTPT